jgi:lysophospholipase L1-like esterase
VARRLAALPLGLVLAALALELVARLRVSDPIAGQESITPMLAEAEGGELAYVLRPLAEDGVRYPARRGGQPFCIEYRVNSHGFRDRERTLEKPPDTYRIALLGDSSVFGHGVALEDSLPAKLERRFTELEPAPRVEVFNCGVYGYNTRQELALLRKRVIAFEPDLVVVLFNYNDVTPRDPAHIGRPAEARWITRLGLPIREPEPQSRVLDHVLWAARRRSRLADVACDRLLKTLRTRGIRSVIRSHFEDGSRGWTETSGSLAAAADLGREHGFALHLALLPDMQALSLPDLWRAEDEKLRRTCAELGIPFHALGPALAGRPSGELVVHPILDSHPNALGMRLLAEQLFLELAPYVADSVGRVAMDR